MAIKKINTDLELEAKLIDANGSAGTSGQILSSTSTGIDWISLSEIAGVDGTGTTNYVAKWTDADTIGNSIIYDNGTNVGIGTTSPNDVTVIKTSTDGKGLTIQRNSLSPGSYSQLGFYQSTNDAGTANVWIRGYRETVFADNYMTFGTNSSEKMRITAAGNVGIGASNPLAKLDIVTPPTGFNRGMKIGPQTATDGDGTYIEFTASSIDGFGPQIGGIRSGAGGLGDLIIRTGGNTQTERFRVTNAGNVGIGTTSPGTTTAGFISGEVLHLKGTDPSFIVEGSNGAKINFVDSGGAANDKLLQFKVDGGVGYFQSFTDVPSLRVANILAMDLGTGNVVIGTTSPYSKFTTLGALSTSTSQISIVNSEGGHTILRTGISGISNAGFSLISADVSGTNQNTRLVVNSAGNVGIGTTSPAVKLHLLTSSENEVRVQESTNNAFISLYQQAAASYLIAGRTGSTPTQDLSIYTGGGEKMRITSAGNVGIGTSSPQVDLDVASKDAAGTVARIRLTNKDLSVIDEQDLSEIQFYNSDADGAHISAYIKNIAAELYGRKGQLAFGVSTTNSTNAVEALRIDENANVGIGTTSPSVGKLQVNSFNSSNNALTIQASNHTSRTYGVGIDSASSLSFLITFLL